MGAISKLFETTPTPGLGSEALSKAVVEDIESYTSGPGIFSNKAGEPVSIRRVIEDFQNFADEPVTLDDLTLDLPAKISQIVTTLRRYGVVILPNLLDGDALKAMRSDFHNLVVNWEETAKTFKVMKDDANTSIRIQRDLLDEQTAPEIATFYASPILQTIARHYFGHDDFELNRQIFVHETLPTNEPLSGTLHFDVSRMLKFWIYVDDGTADAGAIRINPGSNLWLSKIREEYSERLIPKAEICNAIDEKEHPAISIEAPAGSLVIFDTDTGHGAGQVAAGNARRIVRGHTWETKYIERSKKRAQS